MVDEPDGAAVSVAQAAAILRYSRTTIYARIESGDLEAVTDGRGRQRVTLASIRSYEHNPPPGSWARERHREHEAGDLRLEVLRLREVVTRLRLARERDVEARRAQEASNRHLRKALKLQAEATAHAHEAGQELDELLTQFLVPDTPSAVGPRPHKPRLEP